MVYEREGCALIYSNTLLVLILAMITVLVMIYSLYKAKDRNELHNQFILINCTLLVHVFTLILQIIFEKTNVPLIYFDYVSYFVASFTPIMLVKIALIYSGHENFLKKIRFLYVFPFLFWIVLCTNSFHGLFYKHYSSSLDQIEYGPVFLVYAIYSYLLYISSMIMIMTTTIKRSGFFSRQTFLILVGVILPLLGDSIGILQIVPITVYLTPILYIVTSTFCYFAIIKFKAFNITPIALRTVTDLMDDPFIFISNNGEIIDRNIAFNRVFFEEIGLVQQDNLYDVIKTNNIEVMYGLENDINKAKINNDDVVIKEYHIEFSEDLEKYFQIDIKPIKFKDGKEYAGTLIFFKDITEHKIDIKELKARQDVIVKQGQLASIGELAGGVAHDINTPISAIKSGILMFREMLGDRTDEEKELLQRMDNCADKIINIVNSMRNQIRNLGSTNNVEFKISDVINDIKVISYNEVMKHNCELVIKIEDELTVKGDPTKLGQVLTNLIINAVQAYGDKSGKIEVVVTKAPSNMAMIKIIDFAGGMDDAIKPYIFKNILTTKGTIGTGLGLYLAYSVIKGEFGGEITFESEKGIGTTFYIAIKREDIPKKTSKKNTKITVNKELKEEKEDKVIKSENKSKKSKSQKKSKEV